MNWGTVQRREERRWGPQLLCRAQDTVNVYTYFPYKWPPGYGTFILPVHQLLTYMELCHLYVIHGMCSFMVITIHYLRRLWDES